MPVHDWTRVSDGVFHDFHQDWIAVLRRRLNAGLLPPGVFAAAERTVRDGSGRRPVGPDVLALTADDWVGAGDGGGPLLTAPPTVRHSDTAEADWYAARTNRVAVRTTDGDLLVAVVELMSPGNKSSRQRLRQFAGKCGRLLRHGVHLLVVDLHPPTRRDPHGIHPVIWSQVVDRPYQPPEGKPFTLAAYSAGASPRAFVEPVGLGDALPDMPLFLTPTGYVPVPLEAVYMDCWAAIPPPYRRPMEPPADA